MSAPQTRVERSDSNPEVEASLLGAMLQEREAIEAALDLDLAAGDFTKAAHSHIFDAIKGIYENGRNVDPLIVAARLRSAGLLDAAGGQDYLHALYDAMPPASSAAQYARIIQECSFTNRMQAVTAEMQRIATDPSLDGSEKLARWEHLTYDLSDAAGDETGRLAPMSEIFPKYLEYVAGLQDRERRITGTPTGYRDLDALLLGQQPGSLIIVGARPSMGKSAFALGLAAHCAFAEKEPALIFSLEMGVNELTQRMLSFEAEVDGQALKGGRAISPDEWARIRAASHHFQESPLFIFDNPYVTISSIRAQCRQVKAKVGKLGVVIIDYLQLVQGRSGVDSRQQEISEISRGLKILAREIDTPIVALSQLSRKLEERQDKRPMLSDLRESGSLEQDADVVMFIYRDAIYNPTTADKHIGEIIVAKHRNGALGTTRLVFMGEYSAFADLEEDPSGSSGSHNHISTDSQAADTNYVVPAMAAHSTIDEELEEAF